MLVDDVDLGGWVDGRVGGDLWGDEAVIERRGVVAFAAP